MYYSRCHCFKFHICTSVFIFSFVIEHVFFPFQRVFSGRIAYKYFMLYRYPSVFYQLERQGIPYGVVNSIEWANSNINNSWLSNLERVRELWGNAFFFTLAIESQYLINKLIKTFHRPYICLLKKNWLFSDLEAN